MSSAYKSYTLDAGLQKVEYSPTSTQELVKAFEVTATGVWGSSAESLTPEAKAAMLAANTQAYTVTFSKDSENSARAYFVTQSGSTIGEFSGNSDQTLSEAVKNISTAGVRIGYLLVRADGENTSGAANVADSGSFTVIINATGSVA